MMKAISGRLKKSLNEQPKVLPIKRDTDNGREVQAPMRHPSELPPAVRVKQAKYQVRQLKFEWKVKRHQNLISRIKQQPIDVRFFFWFVDITERFLVWGIQSYAGSREFLSAHRAGYCSKKDREGREKVCGVNCSSAFTFDSAEFCVSCNCGLWSLAKLPHKRKLAKLGCPEGKYGKTKGWIGRCVNCLARKSSRESKRGKTTRRRRKK